MLRGIFSTPGITKEQADFYVDLFKKVAETPDWKQLMEQGAFNQTMMSGDQYKTWLAAAEKQHYDLMKEAGFLAPGK
jgi:tripartite-type tricarboxylate transporter receptor subunit TctC